MLNDFRGKTVLITGGTKGLGLAISLAFARQGARCVLTHKWGSANEEKICQQFSDLNAPDPLIIQADVESDEDKTALFAQLVKCCSNIEAFISTAVYAARVQEFSDYNRRNLLKSIEYTTWPILGYLKTMHEVFGQYPRYVIALSGSGQDTVYPNYDFFGASKAALETLCRYLAIRLRDDGVRVNVVRAGIVNTESLAWVIDDQFVSFLKQHELEQLLVDPDEVGKAVLGMCSGLMDSVSGEVVNIDHGAGFYSTLAERYGSYMNHKLGDGNES